MSANLKDLAGLTSYLLNLDMSFPQTRTYTPALDLLDAYQNQKIVYVGLATNAFKETAKIFGRVLFNDLQTATATIQRERAKINPFAVMVDEAGSVLTQGSIDWLNKCRSAGFLSVFGIQSLADLEGVSPTFKTQVMANTNTLVVLRPNDFAGAEDLAMTFGTKNAVKRTDAYEAGGFFGDSQVGYSLRDVKEFHVAPDTIKELPDGRAAVLIRGNKTVRGVWDLYRLRIPEGHFEDWLPKRAESAAPKRGLNASALLNGKHAESNASGGDSLPPKPRW